MMRALVFREHALQLQQQRVFRRLPDRAVEEHDLGAGARELLDQHRLMRVRPGQTVGRVHVDDVDGRHGREVVQALQGGPDQAHTALPVVGEAQLGLDLMAVRGRTRQQRLDLAVDGVAFSLLIGRYPGVDRPLRQYSIDCVAENLDWLRPDRGYEPYPPRGRCMALHHSPPFACIPPAARGAGKRP